MEFNVSSSLLLKKLQAVGSVVSSNPTLPVLENFLFDVQNDKITIFASDLENSIIMDIEAEIISTGKCTIPAKLLQDVLKSFTDQPLTIKERGDSAVEIISLHGTHNLTGYDATDFPKIPAVKNGTTIKVQSADFMNGVLSTIFCAGDDDMRPAMSGVFIEFSPEGSVFVATDSHRLVKYNRKDIVADTKNSFILPRKPATILKNLLSGENQEVEISFNAKTASIQFGTTILFARLIDAKFPNYEAVIPQNNPYKLTIDRQGLLSSVKRVALLSNKLTHQVRLDIKDNKVEVSSQDLDYGNSAVEHLPCAFEGIEGLQIAFNAKYLQEMLSNLKASTISIEMSAPNRAAILVELDEAGVSSNENLIMLVMPIMVPTYA